MIHFVSLTMSLIIAQRLVGFKLIVCFTPTLPTQDGRLEYRPLFPAVRPLNRIAGFNVLSMTGYVKPRRYRHGH